MKIRLFKNGAVVTFEKLFPSGMYLVQIRAPNGYLHDKVMADDYKEALYYRRAFIAIAKGMK